MNLKEILNGKASFESRFIKDRKTLKAWVDYLRQGKFRIVLTQGVFDLLHIGHARYLEVAKSHGDILIVGVDSDELARSRKELNRPIVPEEERLQLLSCLRSVDLLTLRTLEEDIDALIELVRPDVLIASETTKDFPPEKLEKLKGLCGDIVRLPPQAITSTTARIRNMEIGGMEAMHKKLSEEVLKVITETRQSFIRGDKS